MSPESSNNLLDERYEVLGACVLLSIGRPSFEATRSCHSGDTGMTEVMGRVTVV